MQYRPARWSLEMEVTLRTDAGERPAQVGQVSRTGLSISGAPRLWQGQAVLIRAPGGSLPARVAWCSGRKAGLEFVIPQSKGELRRAGLMPEGG